MLTSVRRHEQPKLRFFVGQILLIWTGLAIAMTVTETLLFSRLGVAYLPLALLLTSTFTLLGSVSYARLLSGYSTSQLLAGSLFSGALAVAAAFVGLQLGQAWLCLPLFGFWGASFSLLSTQVFGLAGECIDTYASKRLFPLLAVGCTCGELLGGLLVALGARWIDPSRWLLAWTLAWVLAGLWLLVHRAALLRWRLPGAEPGRKRRHTLAVMDYIRGASMARALVLLAVGMVLCQAFSQYLFSQVFARSYPNPCDLAGFLGTLVAVTNLAELLIAGVITPRLVTALGVARASLLHPLAILVGLALLTGRFALESAVALWISRRTLQDSLATPVRNLLYNAIPMRLRGYLRAFLDGIVLSCSQFSVAILLLALQQFWTPEQICWPALGMGLVYLGGAYTASRHYLSTLVGQLDAEGLRLEQRSDPVPHDRLQLAPPLKLSEMQANLQSLSQDPALVADTLGQLAGHPDPLALQVLGEALGSESSWLRRGAARQLARIGRAGVRAVQPYLHSDRPATVEAALETLGSSASDWGGELLQAQLGAHVRRAALAWLAADRLEAEATSLEQRFLVEALHHQVATQQHLAFRALRWLEGEEVAESVRLALAAQGGRSANALEVLSNLGDRNVAQLFVTLLEANGAEDRRRLLRESLHQGPPADLVAWALHSADPWVRWAALRLHTPPTAVQRRKIQQLVALRGCAPFSQLQLDDLEKLRRSLLEERFDRPIRLWRQGDELSRGFILLEGQLPAGPGYFYGGVELAGRFAARKELVSAGPLRLLSVRRTVLERAIQELPRLGVGCFGWLSRELRRCEQALQSA